MCVGVCGGVFYRCVVWAYSIGECVGGGVFDR